MVYHTTSDEILDVFNRLGQLIVIYKNNSAKIAEISELYAQLALLLIRENIKCEEDLRMAENIKALCEMMIE